MTLKNILLFSVSVIIAASLTLPGCGIFPSGKFQITEIGTSFGIDKNLKPEKKADSFPAGTSSVYCWFKWRNADINMQLVAKWRYDSENTDILDYPFVIPREDGSGSVLLAMPEGKALPAGSYRIDIVTNKSVIRSHTFKIE